MEKYENIDRLLRESPSVDKFLQIIDGLLGFIYFTPWWAWILIFLGLLVASKILLKVTIIAWGIFKFVFPWFLGLFIVILFFSMLASGNWTGLGLTIGAFFVLLFFLVLFANPSLSEKSKTDEEKSKTDIPPTTPSQSI